MPDDLYRRVDACRSCGSQNLSTVLDLGTPYISDFLEPGTEGDRAPLVMARCEDCTLVQTRHTVARERLFREYWYKSGTNESMVAALRDVVEDVREHCHLTDLDFVLDIGANDGTLLGQYNATGPVAGLLGVDPCPQAGSLHIHEGYFPESFPDIGLPGYKAITSVAMFYAQDDPHAFVQAIKRILHPEGVWVVQLQDMASVLRDHAFDYFCHEHVCLYSLHSFERLIHGHGLEIQDWSTNDVNGGSLRIIVGHGNRLVAERGPEDEPQAWADFATAIADLKADTLSLLRRLKGMGSKVLGYGASTKGNTLLQFYGIGPELLPAIAERQSAKWGRRTVGSDIPIISEDEARRMKPDYFFVLPWGFAAAFEQRETVPLILPLPELAMRVRLAVAA